MQSKLQRLWDEMIKAAEQEQTRDDRIIVHSDRQALFQENFDVMYYDILNSMMAKEVIYLDRYKVTSIIICSVIKTKIIDIDISNSEKEFMGNYYLALSAGLSYLQYEINQERKANGKPPLGHLSFPQMADGEADYKQNIIQVLYHADKNNKLDIIFLSQIMMILGLNNQ